MSGLVVSSISNQRQERVDLDLYHAEERLLILAHLVCSTMIMLSFPLTLKDFYLSMLEGRIYLP